MLSPVVVLANLAKFAERRATEMLRESIDLQVFSVLVLLGMSNSLITFTTEILDVSFAFGALVLLSTNVDLIFLLLR
jgi:anti-anti-sigma regulatory factor